MLDRHVRAGLGGVIKRDDFNRSSLEAITSSKKGRVKAPPSRCEAMVTSSHPARYYPPSRARYCYR
jgi:hypothetical protein